MSLHAFLLQKDPFGRHVPSGMLVDSHTRESLLLVTLSRQWPLLIDPNGEGLALLYRLRSAGHWKTTYIGDPGVEEQISQALESGIAVLLQVTPAPASQ